MENNLSVKPSTRLDPILDAMATNARFVTSTLAAAWATLIDHVLVEFPVLRYMNRTRGIVWIPNFRKSHFYFLNELVNMISWESVLRDKRAV